KLGDLKREGVLQRDAQTKRILPVLFYLLARPFAPGAAITIKASNATNVLAADVAEATDGKSLFLFSDCLSFLASLERKGQMGAHYGRSLLTLTKNDGDNEQAKWPLERLFEMSDLETSAVAWHMEIAEFNRVWPRLGPARAASLDCDSFFFSPASALSKIDEFFGLGLGLEHIRQTVQGNLLRRNAKDGSQEHGAWQRRMAQ